MKERACRRCNKKYIPTARGQKFCGTQKEKGSCSWIVSNEKRDKWISENKERYDSQRKRWWEDFKKSEKYSTYLENRKKQYLRFRFKLLEQFNFKCFYCGRSAPNVELQIDHVHPRSRGGKTKKENFVVACVECNLGKGDVIIKLNK